jgi:hypothetical protein
MFSILYVYGRLREDIGGANPFKLTDANQFARIERIRITIGNNTANLNTYQHENLFRIMMKNGYKFSMGKFTLDYTPYTDEIRQNKRVIPGTGTLLALRPDDLEMPVDLSEMAKVNLGVDIEVDIRGLHSGIAERDYEIIATTSTRNMLSISNAESRDESVTLTSTQIMNAPVTNTPILRSKALTGGSCKGGRRVAGSTSGGQEISLKDLKTML